MSDVVEVQRYPRKARKGSIKPKVKRKKEKSISRLKRDLDSIFSLYIRTKYSKNGMCECYTCGKKLPIKKAHCGHFVSRLYLATRWSESNTRPQCPGCNLFGNGKPLDFEEHLIQDLGAEAVSALKLQRHELWKLNRDWYNDKTAYFQGELDLLISKGEAPNPCNDKSNGD